MAKKLDLNIKVDEKNLTDTFGKFMVQPLERGYGITIGNA
ncbi:MAG: DNA-directed RNA polymerase subunit alpha, partial [Candidatus Neomarinimicrobiota bacterium]